MNHLSGKKILLCMGLLIFTSSLFAVEKIPEIQWVNQFGKVLLAQTMGISPIDGQGGFYLAREVLGGQLYVTKQEDEQALILAENENQETEKTTVAIEKNAVDEKTAGDVFRGETATASSQPVAAPVKKSNVYVEKLKNTLDVDYLWNKFYIVDSTTSVSKSIFNVKKLLQSDLRMKKKTGKKQILIYHTHGASEAFSDSKTGNLEDSVVGVGMELATELEKRGYGVYHEKKQYDWIDGRIERSLAYNKALDGVTNILNSNKDIDVVIDLHRDSVGKGKHTYTTINGKKTAIVMFFNGMSRTHSGEIAYLYNPNLQGNLAFSLQLKCKAMEYYDGFTKPIYLKGYRYNLHLKKRSLLIELGNENNTVAEAKNAAAPLAVILDQVLSGTD